MTEEPETVPADTSGCDPRVAKYTKLLQDYFADLERMEQQQHYDAPLQEAWAVNAIRLRSALNAVGPAGLGESCWMEPRWQGRGSTQGVDRIWPIRGAVEMAASSFGVYPGLPSR